MSNSSNALSLGLSVLRSDFSASYPSQIAWTILRVVAGTVMIHNGLDKLADVESFAMAYVQVIGLPFPIFFSYLAGLTELIAAPMLILGLFTRPAALGLFSTMLVAMYHHIKVAGLSIPYLELSALYSVVFLFFTVNGPGLFAVDTWLASWLGAAMSSPVTSDAVIERNAEVELATK